jgi:hypothetical protein
MAMIAKIGARAAQSWRCNMTATSMCPACGTESVLRTDLVMNAPQNASVGIVG